MIATKKKISDFSDECHQLKQQLHDAIDENTHLRVQVLRLTTIIDKLQGKCNNKEEELKREQEKK